MHRSSDSKLSKKKKERFTQWLFMERLLTLPRAPRNGGINIWFCTCFWLCLCFSHKGVSLWTPVAWMALIIHITVIISLRIISFLECLTFAGVGWPNTVEWWNRNAAPPDWTTLSPWRADTVSCTFKYQYKPPRSEHALPFEGCFVFNWARLNQHLWIANGLYSTVT